jgi:hypothetical protein
LRLRNLMKSSKSWHEFLYFVEEKSAMLPTYWSILEGGEEGDFNELSNQRIHEFERLRLAQDGNLMSFCTVRYMIKLSKAFFSRKHYANISRR